mmetsp:Transcript_77528/g.185932  ORF Transcript_77528/g.185932 Transcript_77528/m.185932 type:complete len:216 (-) Transcript_77528:1556-2203(-)
MQSCSHKLRADFEWHRKLPKTPPRTPLQSQSASTWNLNTSRTLLGSPCCPPKLSAAPLLRRRRQNLLRHDRTRSIFGEADICHGQLPQPDRCLQRLPWLGGCSANRLCRCWNNFHQLWQPSYQTRRGSVRIPMIPERKDPGPLLQECSHAGTRREVPEQHLAQPSSCQEAAPTDSQIPQRRQGTYQPWMRIQPRKQLHRHKRPSCSLCSWGHSSF